MQEAKIVPDAIDVAPTKVLQITYPNGVVVKQGNDLTPTQVKDQPTLHWDADEYKLYTLLMTDLDPPREMTEVSHWLVVNIPGCKLSEGQTVMEFVGSGPSLESGKHRYVFFVFEQANAIKTNVFIMKTTIEGRINKTTRDLIKEYNLGVPVAGNFYCLYLSFEVVSPHINQTNSKMQEAGIVPDVIDVAPTKVVQVTYPNGLEVNQGNELTPTQVKNQPAVHWDADENSLYTLLMTDPDASEQFREVRHWLVVNIPGNKVSEGQSIVDYVGSGPPLGSGKHRYIFLVFKQPNEIKTSLYISNKTRTGRTSTKARDLIN